MFIIFIGYVGIILGYKSNKNKMLSTIVIGFGLFNPNVMNLINTTETINIETIKLLLYVAIGIYFTYIVALYLLGKKFLNRGINVD